MKQSSTSNESTLEAEFRSNYVYESHVIRQATTINNMRLTILLLVISCSFLILTLPAFVVNLIIAIKSKARSSAFLNNINSNYDNSNSSVMCYYHIARFIMIVNHSINFILYFVVGKRFRQDLKNLCKSYCRR